MTKYAVFSQTSWLGHRPRLERRVSVAVAQEVADRPFRIVRIVHFVSIALYFASFLLATTTAFFFSRISSVGPDEECLLGAQWKFARISDDALPLQLNTDRSSWGNRHLCQAVQYGFVLAAMTCIVLMWFAIMFRPFRRAFLYRKPTTAARLVLPRLIIGSVAFGITLTCALLLNKGIRTWCTAMVAQVEQRSSGWNCERPVAIQFNNAKKQPETRNFASFANAACLTSWIAVGVCASTEVVNLLRILLHMDFPRYFFLNPNEINRLESAIVRRCRSRTLLGTAASARKATSPPVLVRRNDDVDEVELFDGCATPLRGRSQSAGSSDSSKGAADLANGQRLRIPSAWNTSVDDEIRSPEILDLLAVIVEEDQDAIS